MAEKEKVVYTKSTAQLDREARAEAEKKGENPYAVADATRNPGTPDETENVYVGTDPIYQNHANDTEAPLQSGKGAEKASEEKFFSSYDKPEVNVKRREALDKGKEQEKLKVTAFDDKPTEQSSPLFAADPGAGDANSEENEGPDEDNERSSASPTGSTEQSGGSTPPNTPTKPSK